MASTKTKITTFETGLAKQIAAHVRGELGIVPGVRPLPPNMRLPVNRRCWAKVTATSTVAGVVRHAWTEVRWDYDSKTWIDEPDGQSGTVTAGYLVAFPDASVGFPLDTPIEIVAEDDPETGKTIWLGTSGGSLPTGEFQGMLCQMVTDNVVGFDFLVSHAMESI